MIKVWSTAYENLPIQDKFAVAHDTLLEVIARKKPDEYELREALEGEELYWRGECALADPIWDITHNFSIRSNSPGRVGVPVLYGQEDVYAQKLVWKLLEDFRLSDTPARILAPKPRRIRWSSAFLVYDLRMMERVEGWGSALLAHDDPTAKELLEKVVQYGWENDPLRVEKKTLTKSELSLVNGSQLQVRSAGGGRRSVGGFAGFTLNFVQYTEAGRLEEVGVNLDDSLANIQAALVAGFSVVILEGTGRGVVGSFPKRCKQAHEDPASTPWQMVFLPAQRRPDAFSKFESAAERAKFIASMSEEERHYIKEPHNCTLEFLKWRRARGAEIDAPTVAERKRLLDQEHPVMYQQVFTATGHSVFNQERVHALMSSPKCKALEDRGVERGELVPIVPTPQEWGEVTPSPRFDRRPTGEFYVQKRPLAGREYLIPVDLSGGATDEDEQEGHDWTAAPVIDRTTGEMVALLYTRRTAADVLEPVRLISKWYNDGLIAPEVQVVDLFTGMLARTDRRGHLYARREARDDMQQGWVLKYGHRTDNRTWAAGVSALERALARKPQFFTFKILLEQMLGLRAKRLPSGLIRYEGRPDDVLLASSIGLLVDMQEPLAAQAVVEEAPKPPSLGEQVRRQIERQQGLPPDELPDFTRHMG